MCQYFTDTCLLAVCTGVRRNESFGKLQAGYLFPEVGGVSVARKNHQLAYLGASPYWSAFSLRPNLLLHRLPGGGGRIRRSTQTRGSSA